MTSAHFPTETDRTLIGATGLDHQLFAVLQVLDQVRVAKLATSYSFAYIQVLTALMKFNGKTYSFQRLMS